MIKRFSARYSFSHYTDIYTRYLVTDILLKIIDRVSRVHRTPPFLVDLVYHILHRLSNIKHTLISRQVCHLDQMEKVEIRTVI
jgi:hypothetical protein